MSRQKRSSVAIAAAVLLVACGGDSDREATATTETAPTTAAPTSSTTVAPTSTTQPGAGSGVVESTVYPYSVALPAATAPQPFRPATIAWDGRSVVRRGEPFLDTLLTEKVVNIVGLAWPGDLDSFAQMFVDHSQRHNGCSQRRDQRDVTLGGAPALLFVVDSCGVVSGESLTFVRLVALHDGFGLIAFAESTSGQEATDADRLMAALAGLEWRVA